MGWVVWLAVPVVVTVLVAVLSWLRGRPVRPPRGDAARRSHAAFLDALEQAPRSRDRGPYASG